MKINNQEMKRKYTLDTSIRLESHSPWLVTATAAAILHTEAARTAIFSTHVRRLSATLEDIKSIDKMNYKITV